MTRTVHQLLVFASVWALPCLGLLRIGGALTVFLGFGLFIFLLAQWQ